MRKDNWIVVSDLVRWSLTGSMTMTWLPDMSLHLPSSHPALHGAHMMDMINFSGNFSFELCKFGHRWSTILWRVERSSLVLLLGAGGMMIYWWIKPSRTGNSGGSSPSTPHVPKTSNRTFIQWLFDDELVEDINEEDSMFIEGRYFGPNLNQDHGSCHSNDADIENDSDISLDSISSKSSPTMLNRQPFSNLVNTKDKLSDLSIYNMNPCPKCLKGTCRLRKHQRINASSNSSSSYSESPKLRLKTSTPDVTHDLHLLYRRNSAKLLGNRKKMSRNAQLSHSSVESTGLNIISPQPTFRSRNEVKLDGSLESWTLSPLEGNDHWLNSSSFSREISMNSIESYASGNSISDSMQDLVQNAREVRRLINDASPDSLDSDYSLDFSQDEIYRESYPEKVDKMNETPVSSRLPSSKSMTSDLCQYAIENNALQRENSVPDFQMIQKTLKKDPSIWKLNRFQQLSSLESLSSSEPEISSLEWDSPLHGWHRMPPQNLPQVYEDYSSQSESELQNSQTLDSIADLLDDNDNNQVEEMTLIGKSREFHVSEPKNNETSDSYSMDPNFNSISFLQTRPKDLNIDNQDRVVTGMKTKCQVGPKHRTSPSCSDTSGFHECESGMTSSGSLMNISTSSMNSSAFTNSINLSPVKEGQESRKLFPVL